MINLDDKKTINNCLFDFKTKVKTIEKENTKDLNRYGSLILWNRCQDFIMKMVSLFPVYNDKKELDEHNVEILEHLDLESLNVSIKKDFVEQVEKIEQYITEKVFKELNI